MRGWLTGIVDFCKNEAGATTVEYALIAALTAGAIAVVVTQLLHSATSSFDRHQDYFEAAR